jgi:hypothetical protein
VLRQSLATIKLQAKVRIVFKQNVPDVAHVMEVCVDAQKTIVQSVVMER